MITSHPLPVVGREALTNRAYRLTLEVPDHLRETYAFRAGQHITVDEVTDGELRRRAYSICTSPREFGATGRFAIGVKVLPGGRFSGRVRDGLAIGEELIISTPSGRFVARDPDDPGRRYAMIAAGSGITPILSIMTDLVERDVDARLDLLHLDRSPDEAMFADDLRRLTERHPLQVSITGHWSRTPAPGGPAARLEPDVLRARLDDQLAAGVAEWFLCGPEPLVVTARDHLLTRGVSRRLVHHELFWTGHP